MSDFRIVDQFEAAAHEPRESLMDSVWEQMRTVGMMWGAVLMAIRPWLPMIAASASNAITQGRRARAEHLRGTALFLISPLHACSQPTPEPESDGKQRRSREQKNRPRPVAIHYRGRHRDSHLTG